MKILEKKEKPTIKFKCGICKTIFIDSEWKIEKVPNPYGPYIVNKDFIFEEPTQRCPVCKNKAHSTEVYKKIKETENKKAGD